MTEEQLAATLAAVITPQRLWREIDARRRELGLKWWQVAVQLDISVSAIDRLRHGEHVQGIRERAPAWLERMERSRESTTPS